MTQQGQLGFDIIPTQLAVKAMRDNGYKNAAHAVAELIDNAIQAGSETVKVLTRESLDTTTQRALYRLREVAVLDDGSGMDASVLRIALQFGNGMHLDDRSGIGRFGMGLPSSSISQCRRVDVWSWQSSDKTPIYSYLSLDEIESGTLTEVPEPIRKELPDYWREVAEPIGESGTLVLWSELDRCTWKRATTLLQNSEFVVARMYRKFIHTGEVDIQFSAYRDRNQIPEYDWSAEPNDPGYLMSPSLTPEPWHNESLFKKWGPSFEVPIHIEYQGQIHDVVCRFSVVNDEVRQQANAGNTAHGQHAAKNVGVSVVRAGRELTLDKSVVIAYDPRERWWGVEVEFPPALDEIFGVTNNKQQASNFEDASGLDVEQLAKAENLTLTQWREKLVEENDPLGPLVEVVWTIERLLRTIREHVKVAGKRSRRSRRDVDPRSAESIGTEATRERQEAGQTGESDSGESLPESERQSEIEKDLVREGVDPEIARDLAARTVGNGIKYLFEERDIDSPAFFSVRNRGGVVLVTLNTDHPAHKHLIEVLEPDSDDESGNESSEDLRERLNNASTGLKLLLEAWARYEDEATDQARDAARDIRTDWGRIARNFVSRMED